MRLLVFFFQGLVDTWECVHLGFGQTNSFWEYILDMSKYYLKYVRVYIKKTMEWSIVMQSPRKPSQRSRVGRRAHRNQLSRNCT